MDRLTTTANPKSSARIEFLDSIRGLAALAVLFSHAAGILTYSAVVLHIFHFPVVNAFVDGKAAVTIFFVLSGFVLSRPYLKSAAQPVPRPLLLVPFYMKRITRIYLPFLCALGLSAVAKYWWYHGYATVPPLTEWFKQFWSQPVSPQNFLKQCFFLVHNGNEQYLVQDWSLGVELKASAMLPFLLLAFRFGQAWLLGIAALLLFWNTGQYYVSFILGILLAANLESWVALITRPWLKWVLLLGGLAAYEVRLFSDVWYHVSSHAAEKTIWIITSLGGVMMLLAIFSSRRFQKVLNHAFFVFLGRVSYGVYLLQFIIILCFIPWLVQWLNRWGIQGELVLLPMVLIVTALVTIAAATIFYTLVEKPGIQLGHRFASAYARRGNATKAINSEKF